ncbi:MAG: hypothetical protein ACK2T3_04380, partial [Candidatus Promineifilaceae bacterium]
AFQAAREDGVLPAPFHSDAGRDVLKAELESYLSDALNDIGVTLDQLKEAQDAVQKAHITDLLDRGIITQEQLDLQEARLALKGYINQQSLMADAAEILGIEIPELDAESGQRMDPQALMTQLEENGLTMLDLREAMHTAYRNAIANAADEGVITDEQADLILQADSLGFSPMQFGHSHHGMGGFRGAGPRGGSGFQNRIPALQGTSL